MKNTSFVVNTLCAVANILCYVYLGHHMFNALVAGFNGGLALTSIELN